MKIKNHKEVGVKAKLINKGFNISVSLSKILDDYIEFKQMEFPRYNFSMAIGQIIFSYLKENKEFNNYLIKKGDENDRSK